MTYNIMNTYYYFNQILKVHKMQTNLLTILMALSK